MKFVSTLKQLLGRRARRARLDEEMRHHLELLTEENVQRGLDRGEARRQAHVAFGNVLATREASEEALGWATLESWGQDFRLAVRSLARRPAFTASVVLVLALGLGVTTAVYTLLRAVLFEPLPVARPAELHAALDPRGEPFLMSAPTVRRLNAHPSVAGGVLGYSSQAAAALRVGEVPAEHATVIFVTGNFFSALGLAPAAGRLLGEDDARPGAPQAVAVLSHAFWRKRFAGDTGVVGSVIRLNGVDLTIVGVAGERFTGIALEDRPDFWLPLGLHAPLRISGNAWIVSSGAPVTLEEWTQLDNVHWLKLLVRAPRPAEVTGALLAAWQPQVDAVLSIITDPQEQRDLRARQPRLVPTPGGVSSTREGFSNVGLTLMLLVGVVLLVTAANSATLLLLRLLGRVRELGVRLALGAGRARLARGLWIEGFVLTAAGAGFGMLLGSWLAPLLMHWLVPATPELPSFDWKLLACLAGATLLLSTVIGMVLLWLSSRISPLASIQQRSFGVGGPLRLGRALIVAQLGMSVMLVALAVGLARDLRQVLATAPGYARASVVQAFFDLSEAGIPVERQDAVLQRLRAAALELPPVRHVGFAASGVLSGSRSASGVRFRGAGVVQPREGVQQDTIDEGYLTAMGLTLLRGRAFTANDTAKSPPVALISERLAREVFGQTDPIGRRFGFDENADENDREIVGVVADARVNSVRGMAPAMFYLPHRQWQSEPGCIVIRVEGDAAQVRTALQKTITAAEPALMFTRWATLEERAERWLRHDFGAMRLTASFGLLATALASIGLFGALGYLVASRSSEIAVRLAIGADPQRVWRDVLRDAAQLGAFGVALGAVLAYAVPRLFGAWMISGLRPDGVAVSLAALVGFSAALLGGLLPARRASRVDPNTLLRAE